MQFFWQLPNRTHQIEKLAFKNAHLYCSRSKFFRLFFSWKPHEICWYWLQKVGERCAAARHAPSVWPTTSRLSCCCCHCCKTANRWLKYLVMWTFHNWTSCLCCILSLNTLPSWKWKVFPPHKSLLKEFASWVRLFNRFRKLHFIIWTNEEIFMTTCILL